MCTHTLNFRTDDYCLSFIIKCFAHLVVSDCKSKDGWFVLQCNLILALRFGCENILNGKRMST